MPETALVIIARAPQSGRVKTRLAAGIGAAGALAVYRQLLAITARACRDWSGPVLLAADGAAQAWDGTPLAALPRREQPDGGLGGRIAAALRWGLEAAPRAVAIGTDCPGLGPEHLRRLVALLEAAPTAFGPAEDGGYWGVGVADPAAIPILADDALPWSTPELLQVSRQRLAAAGFPAAVGEALSDCDDADDLAVAVAAGFLAWPHPSRVRA